MASRIALSILCVIMTACGHNEGLRVEWSEPPPSARAESTMPDETEPDADGEDAYAVEVSSLIDPVLGVVFYDPSDGRFELRPLDCSWQGRRCVGLLPYEARRSHYFAIGTRRLCPDVRLYRNGLEIDVERMRLRSCAFAFEADPD